MTCLLVAVEPSRSADCRSPASANVDWSECRKRQLMLGGSDLDGANLYDADISFTDLGNSSLKGANLEKATLIRSSLANSRADGAKFDRIEAYRSEMSNLSAANASFVAAEMQRVNLKGADLTGTIFTKAELGRVNFEKSLLTGADFSFANLSRANFRGAKLDGTVNFEDAFMFRTRLDGIDLSTAVGLKQDQVNLACGDEKTILPTGLDKPKDWPCVID